MMFRQNKAALRMPTVPNLKTKSSVFNPRVYKLDCLNYECHSVGFQAKGIQYWSSTSSQGRNKTRILFCINFEVQKYVDKDFLSIWRFPMTQQKKKREAQAARTLAHHFQIFHIKYSISCRWEETRVNTVQNVCCSMLCYPCTTSWYATIHFLRAGQYSSNTSIYTVYKSKT